MTAPTVYDIRLTPKTPLDGTTVTSADLELPGPLRTLAWAVVLDDASSIAVHMLIDSHDLNACGEVALRVAPAHLGHPLTTGIWAVTTNDIANAKVGTYPEPALVADTVAELDMPDTRWKVEHPTNAWRSRSEHGESRHRSSASAATHADLSETQHRSKTVVDIAQQHPRQLPCLLGQQCAVDQFETERDSNRVR